MHLVTTLVAFAVALGTLIIVHEFGHYLVARWSGMRVDRFSIGFGPPIVTFQRGETLSAIASSTVGAGAKSPHTRSWMVAIYQANPRAFEKNMNVLHTGAILRIPDAAQAAAVSPSDAAAEIRRQYAAWRSATGAPAGG